MELRELIQLFDHDQRISLDDPLYRREELAGVVRQVPLMPGRLGFVIYSDLNEHTAGAAIRAQIDRFSDLGIDFEWKLYHHDNPPDLIERLKQQGFILEETESIMLLELDQAPFELLKPMPEIEGPKGRVLLNENIEIRRINKVDDLEDVVKVEEAVWGEKMEWIPDYLGSYLHDFPDLISIYVAYVEGIPSAAAWAFYFSNSLFGSLWGGSTLVEQRGKGLYTDLLAVRAQDAIQRKRQFLVVDASGMSRPILEKYRFRLLDYSSPCKWQVNNR